MLGLLAMVAALGLGGGDVDIRRGDLPEPAPTGWPELGLHPGYRVQYVDTKAQADALCRALNVSAADQFANRQLASCVSPKDLLVVLQRTPGDPAKQRALERHEFPHTWGLKHMPSGHDWLNPDGSPAQDLTLPEVAMKRAMAEAQERQRLASAVRGPAVASR